jgi:hypothetical protein
VRLAALLVALSLAGCKRDAARSTSETPEPVVPEESRRELFERVRALGGFTPDAWAVWDPVWPKPRDEVRILYDLEAPGAPLRAATGLRWIHQPAEGEPIERAAEIQSGIALVRVPARELSPGRFRFQSGSRTDDNCGNPHGLGIVETTPVWRSAESDNFVYKWLDGDPVESRVRMVLVRLERRRKAILTETGIEAPAGKLTFLHYAGADSGLLHQAQRGNNYDWSRNLIFSSEAEDDAHELAHLLFFRNVGRHVGFFDEGVAIHFGQELAVGSGWRDRPCDAWALDALAAGKLPALSKLLTPEGMYAGDWSIVGDVHYPAGCSFVAYLVARFGVPKLIDFLRGFDCTTQHDAAHVTAVFERVFRTSFDDAELAWKKQLTAPRARAR